MRQSAMQLLPALAFGVSLQLAVGAHAAPADINDDDYINPDRPGIAESSYVVGAGRIQIETGIQQEYRSGTGNHSRTLFVPTLLRFGLDKNLEVRIEGDTYTWMKESDAVQGVTRSEGIGPTSIGLKYHFVDAIGAQRPSVGAIVRFFPRSGTGSFRTAHATGDFRIAADWDLSPQWSLNPNLGVGIYEDDAQRSYTARLAAVTLSYNPNRNLNLFVDTGIEYPEMKHGRTAATIDIGAAYVIGRDVQLDFSVGSRAAGTTPPRLFLSAGISRRL